MDLRVFASLPDRDLRREGILIGEGRFVAERVAARCRLLGILAEPSAANEAELLADGRCPVTVLEKTEIESLAGYAFHRGILVAAERPRSVPLTEAVDRGFMMGERAGAHDTGKSFSRIIVLPKTTDAENLGSVARTAAALGWDALILGPESCDPYGRRALRCSMAATLVLPIYAAASGDDLSLLRSMGWTAVAAEPAPGAAEPSILGGIERLALVLGNEKDGIPGDWRKRCEHTVAIPQGRYAEEGVDSLNVAAAAAVLLWEGRSGLRATHSGS